MPRKRFTNEQIAFALRQAENGATVDCVSACNFDPLRRGIGVQFRVWRTLDAVASPGADQPCFEQIELGPTVHLPLDELEAGDLPLGLAVRPRLDQRRSDSRPVSR